MAFSCFILVWFSFLTCFYHFYELLAKGVIAGLGMRPASALLRGLALHASAPVLCFKMSYSPSLVEVANE